MRMRSERTGTSFWVGEAQSRELKEVATAFSVHARACPPAGRAEAATELAQMNVPGVHDFQVFRQCSPKNDFQYGFFMRFANRADFEAYTAHPEHAKFVNERWDTEVTRFQESDFQTK